MAAQRMDSAGARKSEPKPFAPTTSGGKGIFKRKMQGRMKGGAKMKGQGFDPRSGRKVFKNEFRSGFKMAKAAGMNAGKGGAQVGFMRQRLSALDSGSDIGRPGERSFLRGALHAASGGKGGG